MGLKLPPELANQKVVLLGNKPDRKVDRAGWTGAVEALEKLISDIKTGLVPVPEMMYIAMYATDDEGPKIPHYFYTDDGKPDVILALGMLTAHAQKLL